MTNPWLLHVKKYWNSHPNLTYGECLKKAKKTYKKKKHGGNPLAIVGAVTEGVNAVSGLTNAIGDQINQGRLTSHQINKDNGNLNIERANKFNDYYRHLEHIRFWNGSELPPYLRLERTHTNNPKYKAEQEAKDKLLYAYAKKQFNGEI